MEFMSAPWWSALLAIILIDLVLAGTLMTLVVVWLLKIPGLMLVGGLGLLWIAYKLIADQDDGDGEHGPAASTFWGAMKTIVDGCSQATVCMPW